MTDQYQPKEKYEAPEAGADLGDVLEELGHTPESFARIVGRNASGLRRNIRGTNTMSLSAAREVIEGLRAEGWHGDPSKIWQLSKAARGRTMERLLEERTGSALPTRRPEVQVSRALANLMQHLGKKEVDRVYRRVFGERPDEKDK